MALTSNVLDLLLTFWIYSFLESGKLFFPKPLLLFPSRRQERIQQNLIQAPNATNNVPNSKLKAQWCNQHTYARETHISRVFFRFPETIAESFTGDRAKSRMYVFRGHKNTIVCSKKLNGNRSDVRACPEYKRSRQ